MSWTIASAFNPAVVVSAARRAASGIWSRFSRAGGPSSPARASRSSAAWGERQAQFAYNEAVLDNTAYLLRAHGGYREDIVEHVFGQTCTSNTRIVGIYNFAAGIVDTYQNVFRGSYGSDIRVAEEVEGRAVNPLLIDRARSPVGQVWKWSNLNTQKQVMQEWAANLGTVGLRIVAKGGDEASSRRVSIQLDHPGSIVDWDEDDRGNVVAVELRYRAQAGPIGGRQSVEVREIFDKQTLRVEVDGKATTTTDNELGVCPYVILRHRDNGREFGRWAYAGSEDIFHWLNWVATNQGESVIKHAWPQWFAAAGGKKPTEFNLDGQTVAYVQMDPDTPPPIFTPLVAQLDHAGAIAYCVEVIDRLYQRNPEVVLGSIKAMGGQSGETIAKLHLPVVAAIERAKASYEHAVTRAIQIAISEGVRMELWDLGTGTGSADAANRAYGQGLEDFSFAPRPALPLSAYDTQEQAKAEMAVPLAKATYAKALAGIGVDQETQWRAAGLTEEQIGDIRKRLQTSDADNIPTEPL